MGRLIQTEITDAVGIITLNRPERHNSLVPELLAELTEALGDLGRHPELHAAVLQSAGRSFSTGGDVGAFYGHRDDLEPYATEIVHLLNEAIIAMLSLPVPIVAAVQGIVTGGSLGLVLASDIVLVAPSASFTPYYAAVGFSPDGGWTALMPQVIGPKRTAEVLMRNLTITAEQAVQWGLASRIVPADRIQAEARQAAAEIAALKPGSIRATRRLLRPELADLIVRLRAEHREFCAQVVTDESRRGMAAFLGVTLEN